MGTQSSYRRHQPILVSCSASCTMDHRQTLTPSLSRRCQACRCRRKVYCPPSNDCLQITNRVSHSTNSTSLIIAVWRCWTLANSNRRLKAPTMPLCALRYACTYNYTEMANRVALQTLLSSPHEAEEYLRSPAVLAAWVSQRTNAPYIYLCSSRLMYKYKYRTQWEEVFNQIRTVYQPPSDVPQRGWVEMQVLESISPGCKAGSPRDVKELCRIF